MELHGRLSTESVEGFGLFLLDSELGRVELALTRPLRLKTAPTRVVDANGNQLAEPEDNVVVQGMLESGVVSVRQQGRTFRVMALKLDTGPDG